jgi:gliding motility-associated-like protein
MLAFNKNIILLIVINLAAWNTLCAQFRQNIWQLSTGGDSSLLVDFDNHNPIFKKFRYKGFFFNDWLTNCNNKNAFLGSQHNFFNDTFGQVYSSFKREFTPSSDMALNLTTIFPGARDSLCLIKLSHALQQNDNDSPVYCLYTFNLKGKNGKAELVQEKVVFKFTNKFSSVGTIINHANGRNKWLIVAHDSLTLHSYLFSDTGISAIPVVSAAKNITMGFWPGTLQIQYNEAFWGMTLRSSFNGKKVVSSGLRPGLSPSAAALIYDFDNSTGKLSNEKELFKYSDAGVIGHTCAFPEFSLNDSLVYLSVYPEKLFPEYSYHRIMLAQVNVFTGSKRILLNEKANHYDNSKPLNWILMDLTMAYDGKIYFVHHHKLKTIERPNLLGPAASIKTVWTNNSGSPLYRTNFSRSNLYTPPTYFNTSQYYKPCTDTTSLEIAGDTAFNKLLITFGDGDSTWLNGPVRKGHIVKHFYAQSGKYPIIFQAFTNQACLPRYFSDSLEVLKPVRNFWPVTSKVQTCAGDSLSFLLKASNHKQFSYTVQTAIGNFQSFVNSTTDSMVFKVFVPKCPSAIITLSATNLGCIASHTDTLYNIGLPLPMAKFILSADTLCSGNLLLATDSSQNHINSTVQWFNQTNTFNNNITSYDVEYRTQVKTDTVVFTAYGANACVAIDSMVIHILPRAKATLLVLDSLPCLGQNVQASLHFGHIPPSTQWSLLLNNKTYKDSAINVKLNQAATYWLKAQVQTNTCTWQDSLKIRVLEPPKAGFEFKNNQCFQNNKVHFTNTASTNNDSLKVVSYYINNLAITNPSHFTKPQTYNVQQKVIDAYGCRDSLTQSVTILPSPKASWVFKDTVLCIENMPFEISEKTGGDNSLFWGDGQSETGTNFAHSYSKSDTTYTVMGVQTDDNGCTDTMYKNLKIHASPFVKLPSTPFCVGVPSLFKPVINAHTSQLVYSGLAPYKDSLIFYTVQKAGIWATALSNQGCVYEDSTEIEVFASPKPSFTAEPFSHTIDELWWNFVAEPKNAQAYNWDFGNGLNSNLENPTIKFPMGSFVYVLELSVTNSDGCVGRLDTNVSILGLYGYYLPSAFSPNNDGINDYWGIVGKEYIKEVRIHIFAKNGQSVLKILNAETQWNGENYKAGTYGYKGYIRDIYNRYQEVEGHINLVR